MVRKQVPPTEPLAVSHLVGEGVFSGVLVQMAGVPDEGRGLSLGRLPVAIQTPRFRGTSDVLGTLSFAHGIALGE